MVKRNTKDIMQLYIKERDATVTVLAGEVAASLNRWIANHDNNDSVRYEYFGISTDNQKLVEIPEMDIVRAYFRQIHGIIGTDRKIDNLILALNQNSKISDLIEQGRSVFDKTDFIICSGDMNNGIIYKYRHSA